MDADPPVASGRRVLAEGVDALRADPNPGLVRVLVHLAYDLTWGLAFVLGLPWLLWKGLRSPDFRRMVAERRVRGLGSFPPPRADRPRVLVHGVSVGEVKGARPLVTAIEAAYPNLDVLVSSTTDTGLQVAREAFGAERTLRFPFDPSWIVQRFLRRVQPDFVVLIELEIWPNFLRECNRAGVPVAIVNGRITEVSHGQYLFFKQVLPQFNRISLFCVQTEQYGGRFGRLGVEERRILHTGNLKIDGLTVGRVDPGDELRRLVGPAEGQLVLVAGSTHAPEERLVVEAAAGAGDLRLVLVPRHPPRCDEVLRELEALGVRPQRLTRLRSGAESPDPRRPLVVDTIGELERIFGLADLAYVGGSLVEHGGQNVLEPASQGLPVVTGPHTQNFLTEVRLLRGADALEVVEDAEQLGAALAALVADPERRERMGQAGLEAVAGQHGATERTLAALGDLALDDLADPGEPARGVPGARARP